jgi:GNAT superfamily N-acetyltransferase
MIEIVEARSPEDYAAAKAMIQDYARWLGVDLEFQNFSHELATLATMYGPPRGAMLLAREGDAVVGCAGLRELEADVAEMKRMFVPPEHRGRGIGRLLLEAFCAKARELGYKAVRLDTVGRLDVATAMYRRHGFVPIAPYRYNPDPTALFFELKL